MLTIVTQLMIQLDFPSGNISPELLAVGANMALLSAMMTDCIFLAPLFKRYLLDSSIGMSILNFLFRIFSAYFEQGTLQ
jgi:hypothetical protein